MSLNYLKFKIKIVHFLHKGGGVHKSLSRIEPSLPRAINQQPLASFPKNLPKISDSHTGESKTVGIAS